MKTKNIKQKVIFEAAPEAVYELLMSAKKHSDFTGSDVNISKRINGKFSTYDGYCNGYNIELEAGKKIVQAWHFDEYGWPDDHFSICTFEFTPSGKGTTLVFTQTGIPEHKAKDLSTGWKTYYWEAMKSFLNK